MVLFGSGEFAGPEMWSAALVFGGIPFAVGGGVAFAGYALIRNAARNAGLEPIMVPAVFSAISCLR